LGLFFRLLCDLLQPRVKALDFLIALGTHQPLSDASINSLLRLTPEERAGRYGGVRVFNHRWDDPASLRRLGVLSAAEVAVLSEERLTEDVTVTVNKRIFDYDQIIVCGPVFPHEVVGFSGGNKYFFPGISGPEVINTTHWLGALVTCSGTIGIRDTPTRRLVDRAAALIDLPKLFLCAVVVSDDVAGLFAGSPEAAWPAAVDLSAQVHIRWVDRPFRRVLSVMPALYEDIWTAAKGMYKLEPVVEERSFCTLRISANSRIRTDRSWTPSGITCWTTS
jgi:nickel-dependent lactate racemase